MADEKSNDLLNCWDVLESRKAIETVLNIINKQQRELRKKDKIINNVIEYIKHSQFIKEQVIMDTSYSLQDWQVKEILKIMEEN